MSLVKQLPKNPQGLIFGKMQLPLWNFLFVGCGGSCINPALFHLQLSLHTTHYQLGHKAPLPSVFQAGITIDGKYFIAALILPSALAVLKKGLQSFLRENQV